MDERWNQGSYQEEKESTIQKGRGEVKQVKGTQGKDS